ncbi:heterokaryon incompatibility [Diplodia corticola]|uniref:Heterokaryon incompatibility n=1 Tax=Diplodia corticola TaxID=236234 RepID=A0A1J9QUR8_9PEZI|nr:heterokaryon incompatibility [Diplodia corticola]OJD31714.1 heterokaryon incompatibility [Diplodia corticola]
MNTDLSLSLRDLNHNRNASTGPKHPKTDDDDNSLIAQLLHIQDQYPLHNLKSLAWITHLQCLTTEDPFARKRKHSDLTTSSTHKTLTRTTVNGRTGDYIAISYPWTASTQPGTLDSPATTGAWRIRGTLSNPAPSSSFSSSSSRTTAASTVRDAVLARAARCAAALDCPRLWIDRECVPQGGGADLTTTTTTTTTTQQQQQQQQQLTSEQEQEKERALHSMDLVYRLSAHPVALLFAGAIGTERDLELFERVMMRKLLRAKGSGKGADELKGSVDAATARGALGVLRAVTADPWWERAWTFQEDHCAGARMSLLIPVAEGAGWRPRRRYERFWRTGDVPGELMVSSVEFHKAATRFCLAYSRSGFVAGAEEREACREVVRKAGRYSYTILYDGAVAAAAAAAAAAGATMDYSRSMTTRILEDIAHRNARFRADLLPIASNCCQYGVRLDTNRLSKADVSLAACILALWLLNGEIYKSRVRATLAELEAMNIFEYLKAISLDSFSPPLQKGQLTFLKSCRFVDVRLSENGVLTSGWLWKLDRQVSTKDPKFRGPDPFRALGVELRRLGFEELAGLLESNGYFRHVKEHEEDERTGCDSPADTYLRMTAQNLGRSIVKGHTLFLGRLWDGQRDDDKQTSEPYTAIFIGGREVQERDGSVASTKSSGRGASCARESCSESPAMPPLTQETVPSPSLPAVAFTAWSGRSQDDDRNIEESQIDKYVSLAVEVDEERANGIPVLRTNRWLNGLCFFSREAEMDVTFAWPPGLQNVI